MGLLKLYFSPGERELDVCIDVRGSFTQRIRGVGYSMMFLQRTIGVKVQNIIADFTRCRSLVSGSKVDKEPLILFCKMKYHSPGPI